MIFTLISKLTELYLFVYFSIYSSKKKIEKEKIKSNEITFIYFILFL